MLGSEGGPLWSFPFLGIGENFADPIGSVAPRGGDGSFVCRDRITTLTISCARGDRNGWTFCRALRECSSKGGHRGSVCKENSPHSPSLALEEIGMGVIFAEPFGRVAPRGGTGVSFAKKNSPHSPSPALEETGMGVIFAEPFGRVAPRGGHRGFVCKEKIAKLTISCARGDRNG